MSEVELTERLDQALEAMLHDQSAADVDSEVAELLTIAADLRDLPRADFKAALGAELERRATMSTAIKKEKLKMTGDSETRARIRTVTPYLVVSDVHQEIDFIKEVFGAKGKVYGLGSQGGFHSE